MSVDEFGATPLYQVHFLYPNVAPKQFPPFSFIRMDHDLFNLKFVALVVADTPSEANKLVKDHFPSMNVVKICEGHHLPSTMDHYPRYGTVHKPEKKGLLRRMFS